MASRPPTENQLAADLPGPVAYITGHNDEGKAVMHAAPAGAVD